MGPGHDIAMALRAAYLSMHRQADALMAPFGLTANQFVLLSILDDQDGISQQELCNRACSDPNTIRAMVVALETGGHLSRETDPNDGRAWRLRLTANGRRTYQKAKTGSDSFRHRLSAELSPQETRQLLDMLGGIVSRMSNQPATL